MTKWAGCGQFSSVSVCDSHYTRLARPGVIKGVEWTTLIEQSLRAAHTRAIATTKVTYTWADLSPQFVRRQIQLRKSYPWLFESGQIGELLETKSGQMSLTRCAEILNRSNTYPIFILLRKMELK